MNEAQVLRKLTAYALEKGFTLTYTHKLFYISLLRYALAHGEYTEKGLMVCVSERFMSKAFSISLRMVTQSLQILSENGILLRQDNEGNKPNGFPKTSYTYLVGEFYS